MKELPEKKSRDDKEMFTEVVNAILSVMGDDVVKIILYGSVARGDNTPESDVDIAVILSCELNRIQDKQLTKKTAQLDLKYDTVFSIMDIEEAHFTKWRKNFLFYRNIEKEGIILWTKEAA